MNSTILKAKTDEWKIAHKDAKTIKKLLKKFSKKSYGIIGSQTFIQPRLLEDSRLYDKIKSLYRDDYGIRLDVDAELWKLGLKFFTLPEEPYNRQISFVV